MKSLALTVSLVFSLATTASRAQEAIELITADSVTVFGDAFNPEEANGAVILLFHQAGANGPAEYGSIIPRLTDAGYTVVSVDQRSGGDRLGGSSRTVAALDGAEYSYCDVMPDLEATLDYALETNLGDPVFVWGSSYSAALVMRLAAARQDDIGGVLAFSPASGGPMADCSPNEVAADLELPVLALRPAREMEIESVAAQLALFEAQGHQTFVAENGVHGSSMLNGARTESPTDATWEAVLGFMSSVRESSDDSGS